MNRRSVGAGLSPSGASASHAEGGLQGQTQAALQQLLKGGKGREEGPPRLGKQSLGGLLKSGPLSLLTPEAKGHRRVPSGDGKDEHCRAAERTSPSLASALRTSPASGQGPSSGQHVSFRRISSGRVSSERYSAPGHGDYSSEPGKKSTGLVQIANTVDEDERF